jgi:HlyD family secretion protein
MMWERIKRWRWALLCGLLLTLGLAYSLWPRAVAVDLKAVSKGPMSVGVTDNGVTREEELYVISAPVTGYASRIWLKAGDEVRKGQLITQMTGRPSAPLDQRNQDELDEMLVASQAAERSAQASLRQAERDLVRAETLAGDGFVTLAQLDEARTRVVTEQTYLQQRQAESARIKALSSAPGATAKGKPVPVRTPISGLVLAVAKQSEGMIAEGTPLITLGDPAKIEVVIDLLSREAVRVTPGDRAEIIRWGGPKPLMGTVKRVEPYGIFKVSALGVEEQRVNVIIGFDPETARSAARLGHGYQIDATIILWSTADALRVPIEALFRDGNGGWRAFVVEGGRIRERQITIGHLNDEVGEVLAGLNDGEQVVLNPSKDLTDGMRVRSR